MIAYCVFSGKYSDRELVCIYDTKEAAENFAFNANDRYQETEVVEIEIWTGEVEKLTPQWRVYLAKDGRVRGIFEGDSPCQPERKSVYEKRTSYIAGDILNPRSKYLATDIEADSPGEATIAARELLAKTISNGLWDIDESSPMGHSCVGVNDDGTRN